MSAINFVVRDGAGTLNSGTLAGASGSSTLFATAGQDISLNLQRNSIISYMRNGQALQITLVDGQVLTIDGFFGPDGAAQSQLFLSASGQLAQVELLPGDGNLLLAQYSDADSFGKWSPDDALYFTDNGALDIAGVTSSDGADATMLGVPLMAGLGSVGGLGAGVAAAAGALLLSSTSGSEDPEVQPAGNFPGGPDEEPGDDDPGDDPLPDPDPNPTPAPGAPEVSILTGTKTAGHTVNKDDHSDGITITGTGTPGASGTITVGDVTTAITIGDDGTWTLELPAGDVSTGEYETGVSITVTNGGGSTTATDILVVDTETSVTFDASTVETDGTVNFIEESDGVVLTGTTEAGASVVVTFGGNSYTATTSGTTWTLDVPAGTLPQGEYDLDISVTATDAHGNTATTQDTLVIDTETFLTLDTSRAGGDGTVNATEHPDGVLVTGLAEANASVVVTMGAYSHTVTANGAGQWQATFASSEVPTGEMEMDVTAISTDLAGNTATASGVVTIDTETYVSVETDDIETDGIVNMVERADGITLTGTAEPGAQVSVSFMGTVRQFQADDTGTWSLDYTAAQLPKGDIETDVPVSVTARDAAGNVATDTGTVRFDTYVNELAFGTTTVEGEDTVNAAEASDGLSFSGTVEAGSTIMVEFEGTARAATVDGSGNWSVAFAASEVPAGTYASSVAITATDAAGNTATIADTFTVDTDAPDAPDTTGYWEDGAGVSEIGLANTIEGADSVTLHQYEDGGDTAKAIGEMHGVTPRGDEVRYYFDDGDSVPDGSHIVVTDTDAAGNANSTLFVVDDINGSSVDVTAGALDGFNIGAIDLDFAEESEITLSAADLEAMSSNDNILVIHGGSDDTITLTDSATAAGTTEIGGRMYDVWDVGAAGGQLIIDQDIAFSHGPVV